MARAAAFWDALAAFVANPQFPVIAATAAFVTAGVLWGRYWYLARTNGQSDGVLTDAFTVVAPYLAGLAILGLALFAASGKPRPWYETAATLQCTAAVSARGPLPVAPVPVRIRGSSRSSGSSRRYRWASDPGWPSTRRASCATSGIVS